MLAAAWVGGGVGRRWRGLMRARSYPAHLVASCGYYERAAFMCQRATSQIDLPGTGLGGLVRVFPEVWVDLSVVPILGNDMHPNECEIDTDLSRRTLL